MKFWSIKIWVPRIFESSKNLGTENILVPKIFGSKKIRTQKDLDSKKIWVKKFLEPKINLGLEYYGS